ncbi:MAG: histidine kinase [Bacteroidales bacterium]|nr:histidine kinase [Bacteroidales bacterium]
MQFKTINFNYKKSRALSHILFWTIYIVFFFFQFAIFGKKELHWGILGSLFVTVWVDIAATYFTVYYLLPNYLFRKKYVLFAFYLLLSATAAILVQRLLLIYISYPIFYPEYTKKMLFWDINPLYTLVNIYTVVGIFAAIKLTKFWFQNQQVKKELENKNKTSELALLRSQLNPHFLFNTLNNIDSLIMTNQEKASDAIIKLSDIMRFMLYDASTDTVPLTKEINYLKSYISLQQMRLKNPNFVSFRLEGNCEGKAIAPILFIPFVENAFKHGQKNVKAPGIKIILTCQTKSINFEIINNYNETKPHNIDKTPGIGLANTKRRLELLYPERHKLEITKEGSYYISRLSINYP